MNNITDYLKILNLAAEILNDKELSDRTKHIIECWEEITKNETYKKITKMEN